MIKRFIFAFALLVLVCGGIVGFNIFRDRAIEQFFANMPRPALAVSTEEVKPITWTPGIEALGTVNAVNGVDLTVETSGIVTEIPFKANQRVDANQVLVQLDDGVERADLEATKAQANLDQVTLQRALELQKRGVGTDVNVDSARAAAAASTAQVAKLQAVLDQKQLRAPFAGTMGIPRINDGQYLTPGTIVATLQDLETMRVDFTVPEQQLGHLEIGQSVRLRTTEDDWRFSGAVTGIDPKVDPATRLVSVRAEVSNPGGQLTPGQFVQVRVELPTESDVIAVVQTAVVTSLYGDYAYVVEPAEKKDEPAPAAPEAPQTSQAGETTGAVPAAQQAAEPALVARQVFVKTGRRSDGVVEILSGLSGGDVVVTAGQNRLSNGAPVKIDNSVTPELKAASK
ncbi:efflux RND transporter periplasmic adaptor subunit [Kumtagia ephedrae]|jgi:membrane fusion protein (multidrug efflux system)|uniref:Efflux transporter periplasmic adaptor subunit n=1 Tax=Kumtagia ephedrae TaxID=2116701 RepID=A0A2P7RU61_9HYPH|nr:efflux RND transporter periplasmic adaptor subunit [Mesorhizobium ephedrae]PSJ53736.1 efflux transporter periplasmic adaptor subunit [Mesorhizobium ephedrae]